MQLPLGKPLLVLIAIAGGLSGSPASGPQHLFMLPLHFLATFKGLDVTFKVLSDLSQERSPFPLCACQLAKHGGREWDCQTVTLIGCSLGGNLPCSQAHMLAFSP